MRQAFTLLEIITCLALSAIVAAMAAVSLHAVARPAKMNAVAAEIAAFDASTRRIVRDSGKAAEVDIDQEHGAFAVNSVDSERAPLQLPDGYRVESIRTGDGTDNVAFIRYGPNGESATYAITLDGPSSEKHWMLVSGLSGQVLQGDDPAKCDAMLAALLRTE
jgi:prepilin-type N-terminal cleavage/methylation domain-containing protein